jgi:hypothetical protein
VASADKAAELAQAKLDDSTFRRVAMVVVIAVILLNVLILYALKRRLDRSSHATQEAEPPT